MTRVGERGCVRGAVVHVVGSINQDLVVETPVYPRLGETVLGRDLTLHSGGKGANQAVAAATIGVRTRMVGRVGADSYGEAAVRGLRERGVDTSGVGLAGDVGTGVAVVTRTDDGRNAIVVVGGANDTVRPDVVDAALDPLAAGDVVVAQLEIPHETVAHALRTARERGARTILNAAPANDVDAAALLPFVDLLVVNEFEAGLIAGQPTETTEAARAAGLAIAARAGTEVVVTLGDQGAFVVQGEDVEHVAAFPVTPVDSTGAGDTFVGALAAFLVLDHPLRTAASWANAAGAHACLAAGAQAGCPTPQDLATRFGVGPAA